LPTAGTGEAFRPEVSFLAPGLACLVELVAQQLVDVGRLDPGERLALSDDASSTMSAAMRTAGCGGALGGARLEHV
jgi:hypothetical protein